MPKTLWYEWLLRGMESIQRFDETMKFFSLIFFEEPFAAMDTMCTMKKVFNSNYYSGFKNQWIAGPFLNTNFDEGNFICDEIDTPY